MSSLILKCIQQENLKNFVFLAGLVLCVINGLRPENLSKKLRCFLMLKARQFQVKMGLFLPLMLIFFTTIAIFKIYNTF